VRGRSLPKKISNKNANSMLCTGAGKYIKERDEKKRKEERLERKHKKLESHPIPEGKALVSPEAAQALKDLERALENVKDSLAAKAERVYFHVFS
jgi:hypothetical protein